MIDFLPFRNEDSSKHFYCDISCRRFNTLCIDHANDSLGSTDEILAIWDGFEGVVYHLSHMASNQCILFFIHNGSYSFWPTEIHCSLNEKTGKVWFNSRNFLGPLGTLSSFPGLSAFKNFQKMDEIWDFYFYSFQVNEKEAIWISVGVFGFSCGVSIPFIIFTRLQRMFYEPGAYDHIAFCVEDLSQQDQVIFFR